MASRRAVITGDRVRLAYIEPEDRADVVSLRRSSRAHLEPWEPNAERGFDAFGDDYFERELRHRRTAVEERLMIRLNEGGAIVGRLAISAIERGVLQSARFGYWIGAGHTGRGYMTEALRLGLAHCFRHLGLHRVSCNIIPRNEPSRRAAVKAGFRLEGYSPRYICVAGVWEDHERYALTIEDWLADQAGRA